MIYLDYNATAPLHPNVERGLKKALTIYGNPSSHYQLGREAKEAIEATRETLANTLQATPAQITFTSSGTEANNQVLQSIWMTAVANQAPIHIIVSAVEHACVRNTTKFLHTLGVHITEIGVDASGQVCLDELTAAIRPDTKLISVMTANNETGTLQPLHQIVAIAQSHGILVHTDAVQAFGKLPVHFEASGVDFMTLSGHKIGALKGVGALITKHPATLAPLLHGGPQEKQKRAGTENVLGIMSLNLVLEAGIHQESPALRDYFEQEIHREIPEVIRNGHPTDCLPNTLNLSFLGVKAEALVMNLDLQGIAVSTGSACSTGSIDPSHVLQAMNLSPERLSSAVRFSLGPRTTKAELDKTLAVLSQVVGRLRAN